MHHSTKRFNTFDHVAVSKHLHQFLCHFVGSTAAEEAYDDFNCYPVTQCTARLLGIDMGIKEETLSPLENDYEHKSQSEDIDLVDTDNVVSSISSEWYIPPRKEMNEALNAFYKSHFTKSKEEQISGALGVNAGIVVCENCAGRHDRKYCRVNYFVCHVCGEKHHRMFECKRAKCWVCLKLGHLGWDCPRRTKR